MNELNEATACYTRALHLWSSLAAAAGDGDASRVVREHAAGALCSLGLIARKRGRLREAAALLERSVAAYDALAAAGDDDAECEPAATARAALAAVRAARGEVDHHHDEDEDEDAAAAWAAAITCVGMLNLNDVCGSETSRPVKRV